MAQAVPRFIELPLLGLQRLLLRAKSLLPGLDLAGDCGSAFLAEFFMPTLPLVVDLIDGLGNLRPLRLGLGLLIQQRLGLRKDLPVEEIRPKRRRPKSAMLLRLIARLQCSDLAG